MTFIEEVSNFLGKFLRNATQELERTARRNIEIKMHKFRRLVFKQALMLIFFAIAFFCLFMALVFVNIEYLHLTKTLSFLIVGVITLFVGILIKALN